MPDIAIHKGERRRDNTLRSLKLIGREIEHDLSSRQVVIKPNMVCPSSALASTHVDQLRGILDYLSTIYPRKVLIAESSPFDTREGFRTLGYDALLEEYPVKLVDLNDGPFEVRSILDKEGRPIDVRVSAILMDKTNYIISAAKLKTHDTVIVTLSVKNAVMGSIWQGDKKKVHQGFAQTNQNIARVAEAVWPDLGVIDGHEGMEGDGPSDGTPLHVGVSIAGTDALSADAVGCRVMGVDARDVGYLASCAERGLGCIDMSQIRIIGNPVDECIIPFRLHRRVSEQYGWKSEKRLS
ncbi:MAG: DUF362 domain-containing protein [Thermodesulfovibrionales bacterium]